MSDTKMIVLKKTRKRTGGNPVVYCWRCKDTDVTETYVGSTRGLPSRKVKHKQNLTNPKSKEHSRYVYQFVRDNGGWTNWEITVLESLPAETTNVELGKREFWWFRNVDTNAKLNKNSPPKTESVCPHGIRGRNCKTCEGASICEHDRRRSQCRNCSGVSICEHDRQRNRCRNCNPDRVNEANRKRRERAALARADRMIEKCTGLEDMPTRNRLDDDDDNSSPSCCVCEH
jgi:hypothetical protein